MSLELSVRAMLPISALCVAGTVAFLAWVPLAESQALPNPPLKNSQENPASRAARQLAVTELQATLHENAFRDDPSDLHRSTYVATLERLVPPYCMPRLRQDLFYTGRPKDQKCLDLIATLLKLDGANPLAHCAQDGIESPSCKASFERQSVGAFDADSGEWLGENGERGVIGKLELESVIQMKANLPKLNEILTNLKGTVEELKVRKSKERAEEAKALMSELLHKACNPTTLSLQAVALAPTPAPAVPPQISGGSMFDLPGVQPNPILGSRALFHLATRWMSCSKVRCEGYTDPGSNRSCLSFRWTGV